MVMGCGNSSHANSIHINSSQGNSDISERISESTRVIATDTRPSMETPSNDMSRGNPIGGSSGPPIATDNQINCEKGSRLFDNEKHGPLPMEISDDSKDGQKCDRTANENSFLNVTDTDSDKVDIETCFEGQLKDKSSCIFAKNGIMEGDRTHITEEKSHKEQHSAGNSEELNSNNDQGIVPVTSPERDNNMAAMTSLDSNPEKEEVNNRSNFSQNDCITNEHLSKPTYVTDSENELPKKIDINKTNEKTNEKLVGETFNTTMVETETEITKKNTIFEPVHKSINTPSEEIIVNEKGTNCQRNIQEIKDSALIGDSCAIYGGHTCTDNNVVDMQEMTSKQLFSNGDTVNLETIPGNFNQNADSEKSGKKNGEKCDEEISTPDGATGVSQEQSQNASVQEDFLFDQDRFDTAIRNACLLVKAESCFSFATPNVWKLTLPRGFPHTYSLFDLLQKLPSLQVSQTSLAKYTYVWMFWGYSSH